MAMRILYLHGFASGPGSKKAVMFRERFRRRGIELEVPDLVEEGFERLTISGQLAVLERAARGEAVALMGSSLGGYLAALYAARHPEVKRLLLMAPAFAAARRFLERIGPEMAEAWQTTGGLPFYDYANGRESRVWWRFIEDAREFEEFPETTQPVLIFHGLSDDAVPCLLSEEFVRRRPEARLELVADDHELLNVIEQIGDAAEAFFADSPQE
jgi:uncharacterized protein